MCLICLNLLLTNKNKKRFPLSAFPEKPLFTGVFARKQT